MTIKHLGGIFGRNPTFEDVTIEGTLTFDGAVDITTDLTIDGTLTANKAGDVAGVFNRNTSNGPILEIEKDGTTVGSLGSYLGDRLFVGTGDTNLNFHATGDAVYPSGANGNTRDDAIDLGTSFSRFQDLYLSSGAYLGGTAAANKLDDYEEGTFTPEFYGSGLTITHDQQVGKYVKIGNSVFFSLFLGTDAVSGGSGSVALEISGFPYAMDTSNKSSGVIGLAYGFGSSIAGNTWISGSSSRLDLYAAGNTAATVKTDVLGTTTNDNRLYIAGQYFAF